MPAELAPMMHLEPPHSRLMDGPWPCNMRGAERERPARRRCSKWTCGVTAHCGGCTAANFICMANRPCPVGFAQECTVGNTVLPYPHKMCNEVSTCDPYCTCDDATPYVAKSPPVVSPPSPPATPQTPPVVCDVEAQTALQGKLQNMINEQKAKNLALSNMVYPSGTFPALPPSPPAPPPAPTPLEDCAKQWGQCGGKNHKGPTCCQVGTCVEHNPWYSQCRD